MNVNDGVFKQADGIFRFIRENLNKEEISDEEFCKYIPQLIEKLSTFMEQYKENRGISLTKDDGLIELDEVNQWKDMLDMFKNVGEIVWNLDKQFTDFEKELMDEFELDDDMNALKLLFMGVILKRSKKRKKEVWVNKLPEIQNKTVDNNFKGSSDIFEKFERFVKEEIAELPELNDKTLWKMENKKQFIESYKEIIPWHLIYHTAKLKLEEENKSCKTITNRDAKDLKEQMKKKNEAIKFLMKHYYEYERQKEEFKAR